MSHEVNRPLPVENIEDLYENAPCGYISTLSDGLIIRANRTLLGWLGATDHELAGRKRFSDLLTAGGRIYYETHFAPLLQMQGQAREIALELRCPNSERRAIVVSAVLAHTRETHTPVIRIVLFDASDRRKYEQELLRAHAAAEEAAQAKAAFIAMVSHEIRSPLGAIVAVRHLLERSALSEPQKNIVQMLHSSSENLLSLVNDVLDKAKLDAGRVTLLEKTVDVRDLVTDVIASLRARALEKALLMECSIDDGLPRSLIGDPVKIRQVLMNLITNAIKFTEHGRIHVAVTWSLLDEKTTSLTFEIADTGIGIDAEQLPSIFDPYIQAHSDRAHRYGGTGLGLAISKQLAELHGGQLSVRSERGKGSTFTFSLPLRVPEVCIKIDPE